MSRTAAIVGASGLVGGLCLKILLADESYHRVIVLSRRPIDIRDSKLEEKIVNFYALGELPICPCDTAFCALGTTIRKAGSQAAFQLVDRDYVKSFAHWAHAGGAQAFALVSSVGAAANSGNLYLRTKGEAEQSVERAGFRDTHLFRPSILVGDRAEPRFGESVGSAVMRAARFALIGSLRRYRPRRRMSRAPWRRLALLQIRACISTSTRRLLRSAASEAANQIDLILSIRSIVLAEHFMEPNGGLRQRIRPLPGIPRVVSLRFTRD